MVPLRQFYTQATMVDLVTAVTSRHETPTVIPCGRSTVDRLRAEMLAPWGCEASPLSDHLLLNACQPALVKESIGSILFFNFASVLSRDEEKHEKNQCTWHTGQAINTTLIRDKAVCPRWKASFSLKSSLLTKMVILTFAKLGQNIETNRGHGITSPHGKISIFFILHIR